MKSVNLLEVEYYCISIMLYKGKSSPSPGGGGGGTKKFQVKNLSIYVKTSLYTKNEVCKPIGSGILLYINYAT